MAKGFNVAWAVSRGCLAVQFSSNLLLIWSVVNWRWFWSMIPVWKQKVSYRSSHSKQETVSGSAGRGASVAGSTTGATSPELPLSGATSPELPLSGATSPELPLSGATSPELPLSGATSPELPLSGATSPEVPSVAATASSSPSGRPQNFGPLTVAAYFCGVVWAEESKQVVFQVIFGFQEPNRTVRYTTTHPHRWWWEWWVYVSKGGSGWRKNSQNTTVMTIHGNTLRKILMARHDKRRKITKNRLFDFCGWEFPARKIP